ncbi:MAG: OB-fold nucleic acid binding domain-containing protein [Candidatus Nanoarchaeia archaeon]|nr:OB-fold nucleic acid binding domain-containing protein [Candidatus Nanoarchaeia archaeon]
MDNIKPSTKIWISNLLNGNYIKQLGEFEPNYVQVKDEQIFKINIVATIINKFQSEDNNYVALTIDDNSGIIRIKSWAEDAKKIIKFNIGDHILVIAKPKEYNNELYLAPSVIKLVEDPNLELMYKAEIFKKYGKPETITLKETIQQTEEIKQEKVENVNESARQDILNFIEKNSNSDGIKIDFIIQNSKLNEAETEKIIQELLKEGELFQPKPTFIKIIG